MNTTSFTAKPQSTEKATLYSILDKGSMPRLDEILSLENEFRCYIRPVMPDLAQGWAFLAANLTPKDPKGIYS